MEKFDTFKEKQKVGNNLHIEICLTQACMYNACNILFNVETMKPIN